MTSALLAFILLLGPGPAFAQDVPAVAAEEDFDEFEELGGEREAQKAVFDPLRGYNRLMFKVNDKFYFWMLKPVARGYQCIVPKAARTSVNYAFHNMQFPLRFVNNLLQLKFQGAGVELGRFVVNSTAGIGGLFDPAGRYFRWRPREEDFGQTFAHYGIGEGFPVVLPLLGPSNLRDSVGLVSAIWTYPPTYFADFYVSAGIRSGEKFNFASLHIGEYESIKKDAMDPYTFVRDAYHQNREKEIKE